MSNETKSTKLNSNFNATLKFFKQILIFSNKWRRHQMRKFLSYFFHVHSTNKFSLFLAETFVNRIVAAVCEIHHRVSLSIPLHL